MTELPDEERLALLFQVVGGLSYREISEAMECPIGTVMSRIHRANDGRDVALPHTLGITASCA